MKTKLSTTAFLTMNLALAVTGAETLATPVAESQLSVLPATSAEFEASFLKIPRTCKVSHAAFDAIAVGNETISEEIAAIHSLIG